MSQSTDSLETVSQIFDPRPEISTLRWRWISMTGPDAPDFLHRLTTVNIKSLAVGTGKNGCFLTVQGKIRAFFKLWRLAADDFAFELDAGANEKWRTELLSAIEQYTFSEKFRISDEASPPQECRWLFLTNQDLAKISLDPLQTRATIQSGIRLCHQGTLDYGKNWITAWGHSGQLQAWIDEVFPKVESVQFTEIEKWRLHQVRPRIDHEITSSAIPLEIGLSEAIAENKGCYPGQEVIEKISTRGAAPRKLVQIQGTGPVPQLLESIFLLPALPQAGETPVEIGQVTSVVPYQTMPEPGQFTALAIVRKMHAQVGSGVGFSLSTHSFGKITQVAGDSAP